MGLKESRKCNLQVTGDRTKWQKKRIIKLEISNWKQKLEIKNWTSRTGNQELEIKI